MTLIDLTPDTVLMLRLRDARSSLMRAMNATQDDNSAPSADPLVASTTARLIAELVELIQQLDRRLGTDAALHRTIRRP